MPCVNKVVTFIPYAFLVQTFLLTNISMMFNIFTYIVQSQAISMSIYGALFLCILYLLSGLMLHLLQIFVEASC